MYSSNTTKQIYDSTLNGENNLSKISWKLKKIIEISLATLSIPLRIQIIKNYDASLISQLCSFSNFCIDPGEDDVAQLRQADEVELSEILTGVNMTKPGHVRRFRKILYGSSSMNGNEKLEIKGRK